MSNLLIGFDSAWTQANSGAIVAALADGLGARRCIGLPVKANFAEAEELICGWQRDLLVALHLDEGSRWLMVGNLATGYIVVPHSEALAMELAVGCHQIGSSPADRLRLICPIVGS